MPPPPFPGHDIDWGTMSSIGIKGNATNDILGAYGSHLLFSKLNNFHLRPSKIMAWPKWLGQNAMVTTSPGQSDGLHGMCKHANLPPSSYYYSSSSSSYLCTLVTILIIILTTNLTQIYLVFIICN